MQHMIKYVETDPLQVNPAFAGKRMAIQVWDIMCTAHDEPMHIGVVWHTAAVLDSEEHAVIGEHMNEEHSLIVDREA